VGHIGRKRQLRRGPLIEPSDGGQLIALKTNQPRHLGCCIHRHHIGRSGSGSVSDLEVWAAVTADEGEWTAGHEARFLPELPYGSFIGSLARFDGAARGSPQTVMDVARKEEATVVIEGRDPGGRNDEQVVSDLASDPLMY